MSNKAVADTFIGGAFMRLTWEQASEILGLLKLTEICTLVKQTCLKALI